MIVDMLFSPDSIITAVGMVDELAVMVAAVVASVGLMMLFEFDIGWFVSNHPTKKMLALAFLVVMGVVLVAEGVGHKVPKGCMYFAMAFLLGVEVFNIWMRKRSAKPVHLPDAYRPAETDKKITGFRLKTYLPSLKA